MERTDPAQSLFTADGRRKYLTPKERSRFIAFAQRTDDPVLRCLCLVLAYTGCRISEALSLRPGNVDVDEGIVAIRSLKKRGRVIIRTVPIPDSLAKELVCLPVSEDHRLFAWSRGRAWVLIKEMLMASGCATGPHATCKGLRHGFGIQAVRCNVPLTLIKRWLGHSRLATTEIYVDVVSEEEREFAARIWDAEKHL